MQKALFILMSLVDYDCMTRDKITKCGVCMADHEYGHEVRRE